MMSYDPIFQNNLAAIEKHDPLLAYQIDLIAPSQLSFCQTKQKELNLYHIFEGNTDEKYYYHSPKGALLEAEAWFKTLGSIPPATVIFVYGIGLGYAYYAAKEWLATNQHNRLIFLEEDLEVLYRLCETKLASELLSDPQVQLVFLRDCETNKTHFNDLSWDFCKHSFIITALKFYEEIRSKTYGQIKQHILYQFDQKRGIANEYMQFGYSFFRNFYLNLLELPHAYLGNGLFGRFRDVPAIICGAGPSLNKNIQLLCHLKEKALILAGGSALNALICNKITPHFGVGLDPHPTQQARTTILKGLSIPFFYRQRIYNEALRSIEGAKLYLTGTGGYAISDWFEEKLGIEGEKLDEGYNVVNFSIQIAHALGCNPIILVGTDLAFTANQNYADGVIASVNELTNDVEIDSSLIVKKDIYGNPTYTSLKWITESEWISEFAQSHPETLILNATEGGIGFKEIENINLNTLIDKFLKNTRQEIACIENEINKHSLDFISHTHILELILQMKISLKNCLTILSKLIAEIEQSIMYKQDEKPQASIQLPLQIQMEEEVGYRYVLEIFDRVFLRLHARKKKELTQSQSKTELLAMEKQRYLFLIDVARTNLDCL